MADAAELADAVSDSVRAEQDAAGHGECTLGQMDSEYGVVCGCGEILAFRVDQEVDTSTSITTAEVDPTRGPTTVPTSAQVVTTGDIASRVQPADPITAALDVIDPTGVYDSKMVEEHILDVLRRIERGAHYQRVCEEQMFELGMKLEFAKARARPKTRGGAKDQRDAEVLLATEAEYRAYNLAKMKVEAIRNTMHNVRALLSGYQSIARSIQSAYSGANRPSF